MTDIICLLCPSLSDTNPSKFVLILIASVSSEDLGESAHMRRLARAFAARMHDVWM